ncbi:calmodulin-binding receptor-like cytoplasmic kinase 3 [Coffea arabica]|uniref:non-specific serine/threonine protein kinase n=1 Tax=Coffea arabica TaxID=13443 RepID=A0A6P6SMC1_COFAR|nr:calmodulin-binding receptor-like cytoplasmic kinase 3 [Coffea arabica]XP_027067029.1 calmodulin-binding receptor-like cytoplasmic kinase 3 [Coffea arabica]XP_027067030.1 calmodulin-binding receptor-like cytoplasmic kinase 3 [Coffea arabica]XP_027067031.1 calmodulin-binding receptor-like cytoplasmic kinase 3 [Coffea arabica]XP_027067032.1 calmodulin-binding receptor-like cytoplasmic kinase 3 [Coffea arabica]
MEFVGRSTLLTITVVVLSLLVLVQLPGLSASGLLIDSNTCGTYHIGYSDDLKERLFYIDGELVDRNLFCKALRFYQENHCLIRGNARSQHCSLYDSLDELPFRAGRKILKEGVREESMEDHFKTQQMEDKEAKYVIFTPKNLAMAAPGVLLLCCGLVCPCFRPRRKESSVPVFEKDPNSMDSVSSLEINSVPEKIPPSPLRVPPSPLRVPPSPSRFSMSPKLDRVGSVHLNMSQVVRATQNFSPSLKIGEGGFGTVYKAQLPDGQVVAIKRAKQEYFDTLRTEFRSEVELLAKIDHRNLVKLLGYVDRGNERLIITEYVPNGTLREHLDGLRGKTLDFNQRLEISIDVAHALTYLHLYAEKQIIHRDVKSSNILLTESMRAKVADFGFARQGEMDSDKTHVSTKVKGTVGYLDPEYMKTYQLTSKSDVYSFGVLLIEILSGRRPVELKKPAEERVTIRWAFGKYSEGNVFGMLDPQMHETIDREILMKMFGLAIQCAAPTRADRPDMKVVGEELWAIRMDYMRRGRSE